MANNPELEGSNTAVIAVRCELQRKYVYQYVSSRSAVEQSTNSPKSEGSNSAIIAARCE